MQTAKFPAIDSANTRWLILAMLFACRTGLGFQFQALGSVSSQLVDQLGFNYAEIGTLIGLFMLPGLVLSLPVGYAGRYLADRTLVSLGLSSLALGGALAAVAHGFGLLALGRIAAGAGFVVSTIYFTKMVADWFAGRELATAMGVLVASWPVGIAMGQIGHVWIAANYDWRMAFVVAAVYCVVGAVAVMLFYQAPPRAPGAAAMPAAVAFSLPRNELTLTLLAASVWGLFNAGYIVYLSFAPRVLMAGGYGAHASGGGDQHRQLGDDSLHRHRRPDCRSHRQARSGDLCRCGHGGGLRAPAARGFDRDLAEPGIRPCRHGLGRRDHGAHR
jgi:predicted MFS family arabinose efflux permease